ncbi:hypothetical protein AGLY_000466, partial [Aphis glycines]
HTIETSERNFAMSGVCKTETTNAWDPETRNRILQDEVFYLAEDALLEVSVYRFKLIPKWSHSRPHIIHGRHRFGPHSYKFFCVFVFGQRPLRVTRYWPTIRHYSDNHWSDDITAWWSSYFFDLSTNTIICTYSLFSILFDKGPFCLNYHLPFLPNWLNHKSIKLYYITFSPRLRNSHIGMADPEVRVTRNAAKGHRRAYVLIVFTVQIGIVYAAATDGRGNSLLCAS